MAQHRREPVPAGFALDGALCAYQPRAVRGGALLRLCFGVNEARLIARVKCRFTPDLETEEVFFWIP